MVSPQHPGKLLFLEPSPGRAGIFLEPFPLTILEGEELTDCPAVWQVRAGAGVGGGRGGTGSQALRLCSTPFGRDGDRGCGRRHPGCSLADAA